MCAKNHKLQWHRSLRDHPLMGWEQPVQQACIKKAFSPGDQEEHRDCGAMPDRGSEDRATGHLPHTYHSISSPNPSLDREGHWDIQRRRDVIGHVGPMTPPPVLFLTSSPCHGQIKRFPFIIVDGTKLTRKAGCNEAVAWFLFPWQGRERRQAGPSECTCVVLQKVVMELGSQKNNALGG